MARRIILLERLPAPPGEIAYNYVLWADVPPNRQPRYATEQANMQSVFTGISPAEISDLQAGKVTEFVPPNGGRWTSLAEMQAELKKAQAQFQADVIGAKANVWTKYGTSYDPQTDQWNVVNNA